jgi:hypothetical protein
MMMALIVGLVPHIYSVDHPHPAHTISLICKTRAYIGQLLAMIYRWLMTMACIDRYMISSKNVYLRELANPRIAYSIVIKIVIICIILPLHNLFVVDVLSGFCIFYNGAFAFYHSLFTFTFGGFLPILIMIICAFLIHWNLASKRARCHRNSYQEDENGGVRLLCTRDHQVLIMLFIQVIIYIISTMPWIIFLLYGTYVYYIPNRSINRIRIETFLLYLTEIIVYLYPMLSFYIYTLTSKTFRNELVNIICNLFICTDRSQDVAQPLQMQDRLYLESKSVHYTKIHRSQLMEMDISLYSSRKTDASLEQQQEANPLN